MRSEDQQLAPSIDASLFFGRWVASSWRAIDFCGVREIILTFC
jgi:hypothetical protein